MTQSTDQEVRTLATSRVMDASPAQIFAAIADPARLAQWWGPNGFTNTFHEFDFRPGGKWKLTMHGSNGGNYSNEWHFAEIVPNERIVLCHGEPHDFELTITLHAEGERSRLDWRQTFPTIDECEKYRPLCVTANEQNLDRLAAELTRSA